MSSPSPLTRADLTPGAVQAAGTLTWRRGPRGREVLLVKSRAHGEWSFPKGHLDPGETLPECAVRETLEETGVMVRLGRPLFISEYVLPDGRAKQVHFWLARPVQDEPGAPLPVMVKEIGEARWVTPEVACQLLPQASASTREGLTRWAQLVAAGQADTTSVLIQRHASATSRKRWTGSDRTRPLSTDGQDQAKALARLLACWQPQRLTSSPAQRCLQTLECYQGEFRAEVEQAEVLSEEWHQDAPHHAAEALTWALDSGLNSLLCTHRPVLPTLIARLADISQSEVTLPAADPYLRPSEVLVAHLAGSQVVAAEVFAPALP